MSPPLTVVDRQHQSVGLRYGLRYRFRVSALKFNVVFEDAGDGWVYAHVSELPQVGYDLSETGPTHVMPEAQVDRRAAG